jgi:hypothetical protein
VFSIVVLSVIELFQKEGIMMKRHLIIGIGVSGLLGLATLSLAQEEPPGTGEQSVSFPPSYNCSTGSPCRNVTGEIFRIEESYWVKTPEGKETHMKVTRDTKMEGLPKVGDNIAAQLSSTGDANAIIKLDEIPKPKDLNLPARSQKDLR